MRCTQALSRSQLSVAALLSSGCTAGEIAQRIGCGVKTVRFFIAEGARRIPGDLAPVARLIAWYRGAPESVLGKAAD